MNVKLDFIYIGFTELWALGSKRELQNENMSPPGIETATPCFPVCRSNNSAALTAVVKTFTLLIHVTLLSGAAVAKWLSC